ncbi:MAG: RagB/SusD family nutrient uptake outer membrane protein [Balneolaceae bacterium]
MNVYKLLFPLLLLLILSACDDDFLVKAPHDAISEDGYYNSEDRAISAINAVYATLGNADLYEDWMVRILEVPSDDVVLARSTGLEYNNWSFTAADGILFRVYGRLYEGIYRANVVLERVPGIDDMDAADKERILGEAKFLRAMFYHHLTAFWGEVPLITSVVESPEDALIAKSSRNAIYDQMVSDLEDAAAALPEPANVGEVGRATRYAAMTLLGKVHLYHENYEDAEVWLGRVIDSEEYRLIDDFSQIIHVDNENNAESIFELQFENPPPGGIGTRRMNWNLVQPVGAGHQMASESIVNAFEAGDPRLEFTIYRDGDDFCPSCDPEFHTFDSGLSATGYAIKKGMYPARNTQNQDPNQPILRYADVLLMYAEAANELDMLGEARDALNEVRARPSVNMPARTVLDTGNKEDMFDAIVHERRVELAFEHQRFFDLRRWGLATQYLGPFGYEESRHRWFPLPQNEVDTNPELVQIPNW